MLEEFGGGDGYIEVIFLALVPRLCLWSVLMEFKFPERSNFDDISIDKKMTFALFTYNTDKLVVDIGTVGRSQVFAVNKRRKFFLLSVFIDDGGDAEVLFRNMVVRYLIVTVHLLALLRKSVAAGQTISQGICQL